MTVVAAPFSLLDCLVGDVEQAEIFSARSAVEGWLAAERALALAQAECGVLSSAEAAAVVTAARFENVDLDRLWARSRVVGYPVVGLIEQVREVMSPPTAGRLHFGATTQDIMDTGLVLQLTRSLAALDRNLGQLGEAVARQAAGHADTVMAARTHGQQAVPTTFGATLATLLGQLARHRERLTQTAARVDTVALFGAGGTAAALGPRSRDIRAAFAGHLGLRDPELGWHVERDSVAEFGWLCATITAACAKLGRNVADLSRTEIAEVFEPFESHRGASSTMPQKVNPISSEALIGLSGAASALTSALLRMQEAGHERSAGEWQIEWHVIPQLAGLAGSAIIEATTVMDGLRVDKAQMRANLERDGGLVMAEAQMIQLADHLGQGVAHDLVYEASGRARATGRRLAEALQEVAAEQGRDELLPYPLVGADAYLGEAPTATEHATRLWRSTPPLAAVGPPVAELAAPPNPAEHHVSHFRK